MLITKICTIDDVIHISTSVQNCMSMQSGGSFSTLKALRIRCLHCYFQVLSCAYNTNFHTKYVITGRGTIWGNDLTFRPPFW